MTGPAPETGRRRRPQPIELRPLCADDFPVLHRWLNDPHVRAWWPREAPTLAGVAEKYGPRIAGTDPVRVFVFGVGGEPAGMTQCFRWADRPQRRFPVELPAAASIDFLVGEARFRGQGVGARAFSAFVDRVFDLYPDVEVLVGYPHRDNHAFHRVLERAGYRRLDQEVDQLGIRLPANWDVDTNVVHVLRRDRRAALART